MGDIGDQQGAAPVRMLVINPNTSVSMTAALEPMIDALEYQAVSVNISGFLSVLYRDA